MNTPAAATNIDPAGLRNKTNKGTIWFMSVTCGMTVANLYYSQPLLADIGRTFHATAREAGMISVLTQLGYALGLLLFVPLGDMLERRRTILWLLMAVSFSLTGAAVSPSLMAMDGFSFLIGMTTIVPQMLVPFAAKLASPTERGKIIGQVMSGLLIGILMARTVSGWLGDLIGWRGMFGTAAGLMAVLAVLLRFFLPKSKPEASMSYLQLYVSAVRLIAGQRTLREASAIAAMMLGAFGAFWTTLVFLVESPPFHYGSRAAGMFGLVGVVGALSASVAGRLSDRYQARKIVGVFILSTVLSFVVFGLYGHTLWGLVIGIVLLDLGVQGANSANQSRIYSLMPEAQSRLNMVYMTSSFVFSSVGSSLASISWGLWGWNGVCAVGVGLTMIGFAVWGNGRIHERRLNRK